MAGEGQRDLDRLQYLNGEAEQIQRYQSVLERTGGQLERLALVERSDWVYDGDGGVEKRRSRG